MSKAPLKVKCRCGKMAHRDWNAYGDVDSQMMDYSFEGDTGTRMYPASYLPTQADEAKKRHPGTEFREHQGCLVPVIRNRTHRLKYLREKNFVELD